jgi:triacylglycerol esterase/lipase EstA (alpha/beta hydrolase family)
MRGLLAALAGTMAAMAVFAGSAMASSSGYNDPSCHPSAAHPDPVVLIHGLSSTGQENWAYVGPYLANAGYCAYSLTYGATSPLGPDVGGIGPVSQSAQQIAAFIAQVRSETGASQVDLVGHSEGAFMSLYVPKVVSGVAAEVGRVVALAPPTHGTTFGGLVTLSNVLGLASLRTALLDGYCQACAELIDGGSGVAALDNGPIAQPGIAYTILISRYDELVTPTTTAFVNEPGVTNHYVQDFCPLDPTGHIGLAFDPDVAQMITNALDPTTATPVSCSFGPPF